ncbi:uncharacterized protein LOC130448195 isoform X7 [Diorhabda sublineata]|uniref:uncharacterized protein LOC130448195 isoform X7 n=1 Tax=Diorhabda sublineata TaxID=1163346 RepID=UPI0024E11F9A|nr:uncharacterized protein LOC130448195 isoform X7 [Diorhabda sublineata]
MSFSQEHFVFFLAVFIILLIFYSFIQKRMKVTKEDHGYRVPYLSSMDVLYNTYGVDFISHQQEDIYNISSQVQNQEQWPTHNAHLSLDHITLMNQMNKSAYDDAPPSYDEVMKAGLQNNGGTSTSELPPPPPPSHAVIVVPPTTTTTTTSQ